MDTHACRRSFKTDASLAKSHSINGHKKDKQRKRQQSSNDAGRGKKASVCEQVKASECERSRETKLKETARGQGKARVGAKSDVSV
eukprot:740971-Pleurochrysis_carterae.AAC.1